MPAHRDHWMDVMRGGAIVLVVIHHCLSIVEHNTTHDFVRLSIFNDAVQQIRMPTLFFLSGLLVPRSLRKGSFAYIEGKLRRVLWPYFLWSILMVAAFWVLSIVSTWPYGPDLWLRPLYDPIDHLWFLAYLLLYFVIALLLLLGVPAWTLTFGSLILAGIPLDGRWGEFWGFATFFFLGVLAGKHRSMFDSMVRRFWPCVGLAVVSVAMLLAGTLGEVRIPGLPWNFVVILAFVVGAAGVLRPVSGAAILAPIRYVGRQSIVFYLVHWPVLNFTLGEIEKTADVPPRTQLILGILLGLTVSAGVALIAQRFTAVNALFEWPKRRVSARPSLPTSERVETRARRRTTGDAMSRSIL